MRLLLGDLHWMAFNIALASIPVLLGVLLLLTKNKVIRTVLFLSWLVFLPNSLYLTADMTHVFETRYASLSFFLIELMLYLLLFFIGILSFVLSLYPVE